MRIVLDTHVIISAIAAHGLCYDLVRLRLLTHTLITSEMLLGELGEKLRDKFKLDSNKLPLIAALRERAEIVRPAPLSPPVCRDKDDDWVLATALAGRADIVITGDDDLLALKTHRGIRVLSPRAFLELIDRRPN